MLRAIKHLKLLAGLVCQGEFSQGRVFKVSTPDIDDFFFVALLTSRKKIWRVSAADRHKQQQKCLNFYNGHFCLASFLTETAYEQVQFIGFRVS